MEKTISKAQKYQAKIVEALKPQFNYTNIITNAIKNII